VGSKHRLGSISPNIISPNRISLNFFRLKANPNPNPNRDTLR